MRVFIWIVDGVEHWQHVSVIDKQFWAVQDLGDELVEGLIDSLLSSCTRLYEHRSIFARPVLALLSADLSLRLEIDFVGNEDACCATIANV